MKKQEPDGTKIFLVIVAIVVLIVAVVGASFAYFNAASVTGNATNKISTTTAQYGTLTVAYPGTNGTISMGTIDLPQSTQATQPIIQGLLKFTVTADVNATADVNYNLKWAGIANVTNTFCQYRSTTTVCTNTETDNYVGDEIYYNVYSCDSDGYEGTSITGQTVTLGTGCTLISTANDAAPYTDAEKTAIVNTTVQTIDISQSRVNYHVLVLNIKNINGVQDYNQGKNFTGALSIEGATN